MQSLGVAVRRVAETENRRIEVELGLHVAGAELACLMEVVGRVGEAESRFNGRIQDFGVSARAHTHTV